MGRQNFVITKKMITFATNIVNYQNNKKIIVMKSFLKYVLATVVGLFVFGILMALFAMMSLVGMVESGHTQRQQELGARDEAFGRILRTAGERHHRPDYR